MAVLLEVEPTSGVTDTVALDQGNFATLEKKGVATSRINDWMRFWEEP
jgi:hypothetical protein